MVYGREIDGQTTTFGTTGYTYRNIFVLYDRLTNTVWYPSSAGAFEGIGGARRGERIPFIEEPPVMKLSEWRRLHPDTEVLLEDASRVRPASR